MQVLAQVTVCVYNGKRDFYLVDRLLLSSDLTHPHAIREHAISKVRYVRRANNERRSVSKSVLQ